MGPRPCALEGRRERDDESGTRWELSLLRKAQKPRKPGRMVRRAAGRPPPAWLEAFAGGGKSELRRAVCRITSGIAELRPRDGQCHREDTAFVRQKTPNGGKGEKVR